MSSLNSELDKLRERGLVLPNHPRRAISSYGEAVQVSNQLSRNASSDLDRMSVRLGRPITQANYDSPEVQKIMRENQSLTRAMGDRKRLTARRERVSAVGMGGTAVGGDVMNAIPRFYDPLEYWDLSGLPWNMADEGHRHKLHKWLRLYYATHYLVPQLVDIFTRFPLIGMDLETKDPQLKSFYEDLFFDQLDYEEFLVSLGREFWVVGEAFPLASFDEDLGIWEREELINPEDVVIENFPMLGSQQLKIVPPDYLKKLAQTRSPAKEHRLLEMNFKDIIPYLLKGEHIPISDVLLKQVANKHNDWDDHGTPILLRGLRTLLHEEKLLASQDAIAERLYSPLILAKLGIMDMGDNMPPFIPGPEELESVRDDFDIALSSDFRLLVHHFGLEVSNVFGREQMPRLGDDFDRVERRIMQVFGVNPSLLSAGSNSQPYASSALQAEFMNQILKTFQNTLKKHFRKRALVVAQAQEHYAYETKGTTRIPIYETIAEFDLDGNVTYKEVPKLLVPDLTFESFDLRDEATERQFLMELRQIGVPIPDQDLMVGISWKIKDKIPVVNEELKEKTIAQQRAKMETYTALTIQGLPVPADLKAEVESVLQVGPQGPGSPPAGASPMGAGGPAESPGGNIVMPSPPPDLGGPGGPGGGLGGGPGTVPPGGGPPPTSPMSPGPAGTVPDVSNERRPGLTYNTRAARIPPKAGSEWARFNEDHPDLGIPFWDYAADHNSQDRDSGELDDLVPDEIERLHNEWPEHARDYQFNVAQEVNARVAALNDQKDAAIIQEPEDDSEWKLARHQELKEAKDGLPARIVENRSKKRISVKLPPEKSRYSIIDPEAEPLEDEETSESE